MFDQWIGKPFWITLGTLAGFFLLAIGVFHNPGGLVALIVLGLAVFVLTLWRLELGIFIAFAELFANSHGHLISAEIGGFDLSLRIVIFLAVMLAWSGLLIGRKIKLSLKDFRLWIFVPIFVAVLIGLIIGLIQNNPARAFNDSNAYFYLAYLLPILSIDWSAAKKREFLQVLAAAAVWVVFLTLGLLYVFTHFPAWMLAPVYTFVRDTRTGELTRMTDSLFRIFIQAQISVVFAALLLAPSLFLKEINRRTRGWLFAAFIFIAATILICLSRSFWMGILVTIVPMLFLVIIKIKPKPKLFFKASGILLASGIGSAILLVLIVLFPLPYRVGSVGELSSLFSSRASDTGDVAISSRWNLLPEMWQEIKTAPILGSGFGEEVTFKTDDPRARAIYPDGTWTTYSFEWGWLDLWLKMGILGPLSFIFLFAALMYGLLMDKERPVWLTIGLISGLCMLFVTHVFSPYLNHPLGLGFLLFVVLFLEPGRKLFEFSSIKPKIFATKFESTLSAPMTKQNS